jgi:hypothetical protein
MRRAIMMLQTTKLKTEKLTEKTYVPCPDYETFIKEIAKDVVIE